MLSCLKRNMKSLCGKFWSKSRNHSTIQARVITIIILLFFLFYRFVNQRLLESIAMYPCGITEPISGFHMLKCFIIPGQ